MGSPLSWPAPPWQTHGHAVLAPHVVRAGDVPLPSGVRARAPLGRTAGLFAYVVYEPPSPLSYHELIWMPAFVDARGVRGYHVAVMYVDDETTLAAGRAEWALPKTRARFDVQGSRVRVAAEDGTQLTFEHRAYGPSARTKSGMATVQIRDDGARVRFRAKMRATSRVARLRVHTFDTPDDAWAGFRGAHGWRPAVALPSFDGDMLAPRVIDGARG